MKISDISSKYLVAAAILALGVVGVLAYKFYFQKEEKVPKLRVLTPEQARAFEIKVLAECQAPKEVQETVEALLADPKSQDFILDLPKLVNISGPATNRLQKHAPEEFARLQARNQTAKDELSATAREREKFYKKHGLVNLAGDANNFVFTTDEWNFVLHVPRYEWYDDFGDGAIPPMIPSKYQTVSRAFYGKHINDFIAQHNITRVYPLKQWLVHIPGRPKDLSDANYFVAAEKISDLPGDSVNLERFRDMIDNSSTRRDTKPKIKDEWDELVTEFLQVLSEAALWNINPRNVYLIERDGKVKAVFLNTEKPGLGGGFDKNFYHKHEGEVSSNLRTGLEGFASMVADDPTKRAQLLEMFKKLDPRKKSTMKGTQAGVDYVAESVK